jgi:hypothetical protein
MTHRYRLGAPVAIGTDHHISSGSSTDRPGRLVPLQATWAVKSVGLGDTDPAKVGTDHMGVGTIPCWNQPKEQKGCAAAYGYAVLHSMPR